MVKGIHQVLFISLYIALTLLVSLLPYLGFLVSVLMFNFLIVFTAFEYKSRNRGWDFVTSINYVETHWAYLSGFGLPATLLILFGPLTIRHGILAVLFPLYIIMANRSQPRPFGKDEIHPLNRLPIFGAADYLASIIIGQFK